MVQLIFNTIAIFFSLMPHEYQEIHIVPNVMLDCSVLFEINSRFFKIIFLNPTYETNVLTIFNYREKKLKYQLKQNNAK